MDEVVAREALGVDDCSNAMERLHSTKQVLLRIFHVHETRNEVERSRNHEVVKQTRSISWCTTSWSIRAGDVKSRKAPPGPVRTSSSVTWNPKGSSLRAAERPTEPHLMTATFLSVVAQQVGTPVV